MLRKQLIGIAGGLAAGLIIFLVSQNIGALFPGVSLPDDEPAARLAFVGHWLLLPGLSLLVGIVAAGRRGFIPDAIDGTRTPASHSLEINLRYNLNTLEQVVLAAIAWIGLALTLPHHSLNLIPAMAVLFLFGRLSFWIGYLLMPIGRAFGMVLTVLPTLLAYGWLTWRLFGG